LVDLTA
jgi:hypothetical protein